MWFDAAASGVIGAIMGSAIGLSGGIWGAVAGINASKGKFRKFVMNFARILILVGSASLVAGVIALVGAQPRHVWYPFLLSGVIILAGLIPGYITVKKAYTKSELKKIAVDDLH